MTSDSLTPIDWRHVAVQVARADGAFYLLTTPERDALEMAMHITPPPDPLMGIRDVPASLVRRCPNCEHPTDIHDPAGCWYTLTTGRPGADLVCECQVSGTATFPGTAAPSPRPE